MFFFSSRRRHTRLQGDWSSDVCSSDLSPVHGSTENDPHIGERLRGGSGASPIPAAPPERIVEDMDRTDVQATLRDMWETRRSEERRVGKEGRGRRSRGRGNKQEKARQK